MELNIDMTGKDCLITRAPSPKVDAAGVQRVNKSDGLPLWSTQVVVTDHTGGEIINVTTHAAEPPDVAVGEEVELSGVVAIPWNQGSRAGVSYRAESIKAVSD